MGVEGLIHIVDYFNKNATKLNFTTAEKWTNFDEVLDSVAESKWTARITNIAPQARTENRLKSEIKWLIGTYAESDFPRDVLIEYLKGPGCKKPFAKSPQEHADRMEVLIRIANRLDGTAPNIDDSNTKKIIFESFRDDWQTDYLKSGNVVANQTLTQIISYMSLCKSVSDSKVDNRKRNSGDNNGNKNKKKKQICPIHTRSNHTWDDCSLNPRSANYGKDMRRSNHAGRGRGSDNNYRNYRNNNNTYNGRGHNNRNGPSQHGRYNSRGFNNRNGSSHNGRGQNLNGSSLNGNYHGRGQNLNGSSLNGNYFNHNHYHNSTDNFNHNHYHNSTDNNDEKY